MFASCERCRRSFDKTKSQQNCPSGCRTAYCSRNCRRADKKDHDQICQFLRDAIREPTLRRQDDDGATELRPVYPYVSPEEQAQSMRVGHALFLHVLPQRKVFYALIDSFRLRVADLVAQRAARKTTTEGALNYRRICTEMFGFGNYLDAAESVFELLPGWSPEKRAECERISNGGDDDDEGDWYSLSREVGAQEIEEYYERHGGMSVLQLRLLAVAVMGYRLGNFDLRAE
ncbi:hypothetical protein ACJ41O_007683 [Fusarium nematophilum]